MPNPLPLVLSAEIFSVENGVLMTIISPATPSAGDPLAQNSGFQIGPTYYPDLTDAIAAIKPTIDIRNAKKVLLNDPD